MVVQGREREPRTPFTHSVRWKSRHRQQHRQLSVRPACAPERVSPIKSSNELEDSTYRGFSHAGGHSVPARSPTFSHPGVFNNKSTWMVWPCALLKHRVRCGSFRWIGPTVSCCASSEALRWKYASVRKGRGVRSEEVGCHLLFRSSCATPNCASVCICGDYPPQSPSPMPPRLRTEPNPTSRSYQGILRRLIPTSHGRQYLHNKVKSKRNNCIFNAF